MKKTILMIAGLVATVSMMAQGSINFTTRVTASGVDAKVTDKTTGAAVAAGEFYATLYWGTTATSLQPAQALVGGVPTALAKDFNAGTGYVTAGKTLIAGPAEGAQVFVQVRAWSKSAGGTYESALTVAGAKVGASNIIQVTLGGDNLQPPAVPVAMVGLQAFQVDVVPEPSILALGVLGGVAFLLRRRS
jgi:hypothetical protein